MQFVKHRNDKDVSWMAGNKWFEQMDWDTASLIKTVTGANIQIEKGESVNMWAAWENGINQARNDGYSDGKNDGVAEGMDLATVSNIRNLGRVEKRKLCVTARQFFVWQGNEAAVVAELRQGFIDAGRRKNGRCSVLVEFFNTP